jgi:RimJ/RimL family protein N-acetyltransferase
VEYAHGPPQHEIRRPVIGTRYQGAGLGSAALRTLVDRAMSGGAHRVWLDVKDTDARVLAIYRAAGFVEEGTLREVIREYGGWTSLVVMSVLEAEWAARRGTSWRLGENSCSARNFALPARIS